MDSILPPTCVVASLVWKIESLVTQAQAHQTDPGTGPPGRLFVPDAVRLDVLQWGNSSRLACHRGINRTLAFLHHRFWWPTMDRDTRSFVAACATCARNKTSNKPRSGLLRPLSIPSRPWSNIALDFVTGLPPSRGINTILTIIDRFFEGSPLRRTARTSLRERDRRAHSIPGLPHTRHPR